MSRRDPHIRSDHVHEGSRGEAGGPPNGGQPWSPAEGPLASASSGDVHGTALCGGLQTKAVDAGAAGWEGVVASGGIIHGTAL